MEGLPSLTATVLELGRLTAHVSKLSSFFQGNEGRELLTSGYRTLGGSVGKPTAMWDEAFICKVKRQHLVTKPLGGLKPGVLGRMGEGVTIKWDRSNVPKSKGCEKSFVNSGTCRGKLVHALVKSNVAKGAREIISPWPSGHTHHWQLGNVTNL